MFDAGSVTCEPNSCSAGPMKGTYHSGMVFTTHCSVMTLKTRDVCIPTCTVPGYELVPRSGFELVCNQMQSFNASKARCKEPANPACNGAIKGTVNAGCDSCKADFRACNKIMSGSACVVKWSCADGYIYSAFMRK